MVKAGVKELGLS